MRLTTREMLRRLGAAETIDAVCHVAGISREDFNSWWKSEVTVRVPDMTGHRRVGVTGLVEIERDEWGIPHIFAGTDDDLFFGFGYAMAQDRLFFKSLSTVSPHTHVPIGALIAQAVWACILTLSGSFDALTDYAIFGLWIFYALVTASVFVFRRRMANIERPYRTWGYPVVPILFLIVAALLLINTVLTTPRQAITGVGLIAVGLPVYWYWARHNRRIEI